VHLINQLIYATSSGGASALAQGSHESVEQQPATQCAAGPLNTSI